MDVLGAGAGGVGGLRVEFQYLIQGGFQLSVADFQLLGDFVVVFFGEFFEEVVDDGQERYQFTWPDKRKAVVLANAPIEKTLRFEKELPSILFSKLKLFEDIL